MAHSAPVALWEEFKRLKRVKAKFWIALTLVCLPLLVLAGMMQTARREAAARKHQHQLNGDLFQAVKENMVPQVEALLAKGAEANSQAYYEEPDVSLSALWQQWRNRLRGAPLSTDSANHGSAGLAMQAALDIAAQTQFKDWRVLKLLVDHGGDINACGYEGLSQSALDWTTELQNWKVTNYLLDHGAKPEVAEMNGSMSNSTPLLQTVACDNIQVATKMLDKGANVNLVPKENGDTALCIAIIHENPAMIRLLLKRGADINLPNPQGQTPLHRCQGSAKELETATLLLDEGADPNRKDRDGNTPLMLAANGYLEMTRLYLSHKADTTIRNKQGQTALQIAQSHKETEIATALKQAGATR